MLRNVGWCIFSYNGNGLGYDNDAYYTARWQSRGVVIVGSGLLYKRSKSFVLEGKYLRIFLKIKYKRSIIPSTESGKKRKDYHNASNKNERTMMKTRKYISPKLLEIKKKCKLDYNSFLIFDY